jgi:hypothetical protein
MKFILLLSMFMCVACLPRDTTNLPSGQAGVSRPGPVIAKGGKPGAAVDLLERQPFSILSGERVSLPIVLTTAYSEGEMSVTISADDALNIGEGQLAFSFDLSKTKELLLPLEVQAEKPGRFYINLHVELISGGQKLSRILAVIVVAGQQGDDVIDTNIKSAAKLDLSEQKKMSVTSSSIEQVISLPAEERIVTE